MRICQIVTRADEIGGAQIHVRDLSEALLAMGHEVVVLAGDSRTNPGDSRTNQGRCGKWGPTTLSTAEVPQGLNTLRAGREQSVPCLQNLDSRTDQRHHGSFSAELAARGIPYRNIPHLAVPLSPAKDFLAFCEITRELRRIQPDLVATHTAKAGLLGRMAAAAVRCPSVFTPHGWSIGDRISRRKGLIFRRIETLASILSARIVNVCDYEVELALRSRIAPASKLAMVHNGLPDIGDNGQADPAADPPRLVMVARMAEPKDHATLLAALGRLKHLRWNLELVGAGPLEARLKNQAVEFGIADRVDFLGHLDDPSARLRSAQIFVLASRSEAFPYSILEAMRAGLPVIASDVGGISEAVEDGNTGLLAPPRDADALASVLSRALSAPALRKMLGANGRRRFLEFFTFDRMFAKTTAIYQQALGARAHAAPAAARGQKLADANQETASVVSAK